MSPEMLTATTTRRLKWRPAPPPPPSPKIIHFPRRPRRKTSKPAAKKTPSSVAAAAWRRHSLGPAELHEAEYYYKGKLENLFGQEREFSTPSGFPIVVLNSGSCAERRERVEDNGSGGAAVFAEEKWRFQAEMLRAECNFLRMEREFALKKLERNRVQMENTLRSAVQTLISGKKKIFEGKNVNAILEEEIEDLAEKLEDLKRSSKKNRDFEIKKCSNFDKQACLLQKRLEKLSGLSDEKCVKGSRELARADILTNNGRKIDEETRSPGCKTINKSTDVELLIRMEGLSKSMINRMDEEYGAIISSTANSSVASSASTSTRMDFTEPSVFSNRHPHQELMPLEENKCSGRCKAIVRKIVEQVKAETEQWSQMQEMLGQVREEMKELQASRDFWEERALESAPEIQSLQSTVEEWKEKALASEAKVNELQMQLSAAKEHIDKLRTKQESDQIREAKSTPNSPKISLGKQIEKEKRVVISRMKQNHQPIDPIDDKRCKNTEKMPPISLAKQIEKEKRMILRRLKENMRSNDKMMIKLELSPNERRKSQTQNEGQYGPKRSPFRDVSNSSPLVRQNNKAVFPWHSPDKRGQKMVENLENF